MARIVLNLPSITNDRGPPLYSGSELGDSWFDVLTAINAMTADLYVGVPGSGTVSSVSLAAPNIFSVSGSPVTGTGTLTMTLASQAINTVFAGPNSGGAGAPGFRVLVSADIPPINLASTLHGGVTGLLPNTNIAQPSVQLGQTSVQLGGNIGISGTPIAGLFINGGSLAGSIAMALGTDATGDIYYRNASGNLTRLPIGSGTQVLGVAAGLPAWVTGGGGSGTVTSVSVTTANGVSGSVATATSTPAITLTLGAITPTSAAIGAGSAITSSGPGGALTAPAFAAFGTAAGNVVQGGAIAGAGPTGSATVVPIITYNAAGQLTTVTSATITPAIGSITGLGTGVATALGNAANAASGLVVRDASNNFSAGTITASLTGHASLDLALTGGTLSGGLITVASATGGAGLNLPHGAAPTSPVNGDLWTTTSGLFARINGSTVGPFGAGGGAVSSVSNSDSSLTISPTTGAVVASLNVAHANTWSATQTFADGGAWSSSGLSIGSGGLSSSFNATVNGSGAVIMTSGSPGNIVGHYNGGNVPAVWGVQYVYTSTPQTRGLGIFIDVSHQNTTASKSATGMDINVSTPIGYTTAVNNLTGTSPSVQHAGTGGLTSMTAMTAAAFLVSTDTVGKAWAVNGLISNSGGGTITDAAAINAQTPLGPSTALTSVFTNLTGVEIQDQNPTVSGGGAVTLTNPPAAIRIQSQTATGAFGILQLGSGLNSFAGASTFGTSVTIGAGSAITSSGAGGALGSNAFTSTAYAPLASPSFTGTVTMPDSGTYGSGGINGSNIGATTRGTGAFTTLAANGTANFTSTFQINSNTITWPAAAITVARIDAAQTFNGTQTFQAAGASSTNASIALSQSTTITSSQLITLINDAGTTTAIAANNSSGSGTNLNNLASGTRLTAGGAGGLVLNGTAGPVVIAQGGTSKTANNAITITSPTAIAFNQYGAGTLTTDAAGNITASSDARLKRKLADFTRSTIDLRKIGKAATYEWTRESGLAGRGTGWMLTAGEGLADAIPEAVGKDPLGFLTLSERPILAAAVNAILDVDARLAALERRISH